MRQLKKRFREIPVELGTQVENLSIEDLEKLGEEIFDFDNREDLENWLKGR